MKNNIDQIEEPGNCKTADGYTKKANPGPIKLQYPHDRAK